MNAQIIEQSLADYQAIAEHLNIIERAMRGQDSKVIIALSQQLIQLQEQVKSNDNTILEMVHTTPELRRDPHILELIELMRAIHQQNERVTRQLRSILVIHREELVKLKKGNTVLRGYRPATQHTGKRISISN
nr:hypothetical protein [uncultured Desulfobulbus sp.]